MEAQSRQATRLSRTRLGRKGCTKIRAIFVSSSGGYPADLVQRRFRSIQIGALVAARWKLRLNSSVRLAERRAGRSKPITLGKLRTLLEYTAGCPW